MSTQKSDPLRGDAAYRASIKAIAQRNQAAQTAAARRREAKQADVVRESSRLARLEAQDFPRQPGR
jgi:hypothetical protein